MTPAIAEHEPDDRDDRGAAADLDQAERAVLALAA